MIEDIHFGEQRTEHLVRVYSKSRDKIGIIKRQDDKPKWVWIPVREYKDGFPFTILESDLTQSKQMVHKLITYGRLKISS